MEIGFSNEVLSISRLVHTDCDLAIKMCCDGELHAKEVCDFWLEINFVVMVEIVLEFVFDFIACAEVNKIVNEKGQGRVVVGQG